MRSAGLALLAVSALSCAAAPPPSADPPAIEGAPARAAEPPAAPRDACAALAGPLTTLRRLSALVSLGRSMAIAPLHPDLFTAEVAGDAAAARAITSDDPALAKLAGDAAARLDRIAAAARAHGAARGSEAARAALLDEMERGEMVTLLADERCHPSDAAPKHSAAALEGAIGRVSGAELARALRAGAAPFQRCHDAALRRDPSLRGVVRVRFAIAPDGALREAVDADRAAPEPLAWSTAPGAPAIRDAEVSACVVAAFTKLPLPKPKGGVFTATVTVELGPKQ